MQYNNIPEKTQKYYIPTQGNIITALSEYHRLHHEAMAINEEGICAALSMSFAFSYMIKKEQGYFTPNIFHQFLEEFQSIDNIELFFDNLKRMTEIYQNSTEVSEKEDCLNKLQPMWSKLAVIDFAMLLYNTNHQYPTYLDAYLSPFILSFLGLKTIAAASFDINVQDFHEIFFPISYHPTIKSILRPGGTYLIGLPAHLCAAHMSVDGQLFFYDSNYPQIIQNIADFLEYQKKVVLPQGSKILINIIAVELINKNQQKEELIDCSASVEMAVLDSSRDYIKKHFELNKENYRAILSTLCHLLTPSTEEILKKILYSCNEQELIHTATLVLREICFEKEFPIVQLFFSRQDLQEALEKDQSWITILMIERKFDLFSYLLKILPENFNIEPTRQSILNAVQKLNAAGAQNDLRNLMQVIIARNFLNPTKNPSKQFEALLYRFPREVGIIKVAFECWQKCCQEEGGAQEIILERYNKGLLAFFILNKYPSFLIEMLLQDQYYLITQNDYVMLLMFANEHQKNIVRQNPQKIPKYFQDNRIIELAAYGEYEKIKSILSKNNNVSPFILAHIYIVALSNQHLSICQYIDSLGKNLFTPSFLNDLIKLFIDFENIACVKHLLSRTEEDKESFYQHAILQEKKEIAIYLNELYKFGIKVFSSHEIQQKIKNNSYTVLFIEMALDLGAKHEIFTESFGWAVAPLIAAVSAGNKNLVSRLLDFESPATKICLNRIEAFNVAVINGNLPMIEHFLNNGYDINSIDTYGRTAGYYAVMAQQIGALFYLIDHNIDLKIARTFKETPLACAVIHRKSRLFKHLIRAAGTPDNIEVLLSMLRQQFPNSIDFIKWQLYMTQAAIEINQTSILMFLKNNGYLMRHDILDYANSLCKAVSENNLQWLILFFSVVNKKINLNLVGKKFQTTPLIIAVRNGNFEIAKTLLEAGALPNFSPQGQYCALYEAVRHKNLSCCQLLINHGARYEHNHDILFLAVKNDDTNILNTLLTAFPVLNQNLLEQAINIAEKNQSQNSLILLRSVVLYPPQPLIIKQTSRKRGNDFGNSQKRTSRLKK